jgi:DNA-binding CsgD family transcriptional regulator
MIPRPLPTTPTALTRWARHLPVDPGVDSYCPSIDDIRSLCGICLLNGQFYYVTDIQAQRVVFVTPTIQSVLGYSPDEIDHPQFLYDLIHPDDRESVCMATAKSLLCGPRYAFLKPFDCTFSIDYRIRRRAGTYTRILRQTTLLCRDRLGNMHLTLAHCTDLGQRQLGVTPTFSYTGPSLPGFSFPDDELMNLSGTLTPREQEIVRLVAEGLRSSEIAERLAISPHTVNTHRRKMMDKIGARNTAQLIVYAQERGYLR